MCVKESTDVALPLPSRQISLPITNKFTSPIMIELSSGLKCRLCECRGRKFEKNGTFGRNCLAILVRNEMALANFQLPISNVLDSSLVGRVMEGGCGLNAASKRESHELGCEITSPRADDAVNSRGETAP